MGFCATNYRIFVTKENLCYNNKSQQNFFSVLNYEIYWSKLERFVNERIYQNNEYCNQLNY